MIGMKHPHASDLVCVHRLRRRHQAPARSKADKHERGRDFWTEVDHCMRHYRTNAGRLDGPSARTSGLGRARATVYATPVDSRGDSLDAMRAAAYGTLYMPKEQERNPATIAGAAYHPARLTRENRSY
jgi:hypothetical protein